MAGRRLYAIMCLAMMPLVANRQSTELTIDAVVKGWSGGGLALLNGLRRLAAAQDVAVYLVGGPVRDLLLGGTVQDLDFVVEGDAPGLARRLAEELGGRSVVHSRFGTATIAVDGAANALRVDLVTARREVYPRPGGLPRVFPGTIYDDLERRDFSVNAMALPVSGGEPGLLAPNDGVADLEDGLIRILHPDSFVDDPTRLLRAVRYEQRLGFRLEGDTESRLREGVAQGCLDTVSGDRLRHELGRILAETQPGPPLLRAVELGILAGIHPAWGYGDGWQHWAESGPEIIRETGLSRHFEELTWLAALAYPLAARDGEGLIGRLNMPKAWAAVVRDTIGLRQQEAAVAEYALLPSQLCGLLEGFSPAAVAAVAGLTDSAMASQALRRYLADLRHIAAALKGDDLLAMGVPPGPPVGDGLAQLRAARQDGRVDSIAGERQWVAAYVQALGPELS